LFLKDSQCLLTFNGPVTAQVSISLAVISSGGRVGGHFAARVLPAGPRGRVARYVVQGCAPPLGLAAVSAGCDQVSATRPDL